MCFLSRTRALVDPAVSRERSNETGGIYLGMVFRSSCNGLSTDVGQKRLQLTDTVARIV
jgi:hypothetical protein